VLEVDDGGLFRFSREICLFFFFFLALLNKFPGCETKDSLPGPGTEPVEADNHPRQNLEMEGRGVRPWFSPSVSWRVDARGPVDILGKFVQGVLVGGDEAAAIVGHRCQGRYGDATSIWPRGKKLSRRENCFWCSRTWRWRAAIGGDAPVSRDEREQLDGRATAVAKTLLDQASAPTV
jgi:hypothetical protein